MSWGRSEGREHLVPGRYPADEGRAPSDGNGASPSLGTGAAGGAAQWDDVANLQGVLAHNHPVDEQPQDLPSFLYGRVAQPSPDPLAEGGQILRRLLRMGPFLTKSGLLFLLLRQSTATLCWLISAGVEPAPRGR